MHKSRLVGRTLNLTFVISSFVRLHPLSARYIERADRGGLSALHPILDWRYLRRMSSVKFPLLVLADVGATASAGARSQGRR